MIRTCLELPNYTIHEERYMELKATPDDTQSGIRTDQCNLWDKVTGFTGCTGSVDSTGSTGFNNTKISEPLICYPNPSNGKFHLKGDLGNEYTISVFNSLGQKVNTVVNSNYADLTGQSAGLYYISVETKNQVFKGKIIKVE